MTTFEALVELHHKVEKLRCGARTVLEVEHYSGYSSETSLVCTRDVGHEGPHKDEICCWRFHAFTDGEPSPEDVWRGRLCSCGRLECKIREILESAMKTYEYNEDDLPTVTPGGIRQLPDGSDYRIVESGHWSMEWISPAHPTDGDSNLEDIDKTILAWIAYRNWFAENLPEGSESE